MRSRATSRRSAGEGIRRAGPRPQQSTDGGDRATRRSWSRRPRSSRRQTPIWASACRLCRHRRKRRPKYLPPSLRELAQRPAKKTAEFALIEPCRDAYEREAGDLLRQPHGPRSWAPRRRGSRASKVRADEDLSERPEDAIEAGCDPGRDGVRAQGRPGERLGLRQRSGMDEDRIHRVMHGGFTSKENGTGLGLSICRHLTGAHGGEFGIESKAGVGTTVRFSFPEAIST